MTGGALRTAGRLPAEVTSFVGRRHELARLRRLLETARLVTLLGPGGVGKTRLALRAAREAARSFPDGVYFVDLAAVGEPGLLAQTVADALDLPDQSVRPPLDVLAAEVADRRVLLVLDTCEHLVDACAMLVEVLLRAGPGVRVLATSRQPLDAAGEHILPVAPLAVTGDEGDEAVALFAERAAAVLPGFAPTGAEREQVARLCRRLEGIPLAIELAAVRMRALSIDQIVARLADREFLTGERRTRHIRHQTLRGAIRWSHDLCTPAEQALWARLSVFADGIDLAAAERVCADRELAADRVLEVVAGLVDKSVLTRDADGRYRMLDTLREYGAARLEERGETEAVRARQLAYYRATTERLGRELTTPRQQRWFEWERREHGNLRDVLEHAIARADAGGALSLVAGLVCVWFARGCLREARLWTGRALALPGGDPDDRFRALLGAAFVALFQGDRTGAAELLEDAGRTAAQPDQQAYLTEMTGILKFFQGDPDTAADLLQKAVRRHAEEGHTDVIALVSGMFAACALYFRGEPPEAEQAAEDAVRTCRDLGEEWCLALALWARCAVRLMRGRVARAETDALECLRISARLEAWVSFTGALELMSACAMERGEPDRASLLYGAAERRREARGQSYMGDAFADIWRLAGDRLSAELGAETFRARYAEGAALPDAEVLALASREARAVPPPVPPDPEPGLRERLTRREQEIAGLVAEGLSNRQIAERLVISKRTVDSHVEHILAKLGFASRAQVAGWVGRGG
ncbi:LuxR C-terminal-related transcriptional regulator [Actinomadura hibisca]|uniref:LuxR C-terminal-related transcriptional regulator n=1 Tax=Actinomadura hibisca TaxID=68565 RepID=UPI0008344B57|nr:LuxR C-terminal-related transcriptional regulator [Actinomadura hibisca]